MTIDMLLKAYVDAKARADAACYDRLIPLHIQERQGIYYTAGWDGLLFRGKERHERHDAAPETLIMLFSRFRIARDEALRTTILSLQDWASIMERRYHA